MTRTGAQIICEALLREAGFRHIETLPQTGRTSQGDFVTLASA